MLLFALSAECKKNLTVALVVPDAVFVQPMPPNFFGPTAGIFVSNQIAGQPAIVPSSMVGGNYVALQVSAASVIWDAITVGYGNLGEAALLAKGNLAAQRRVRQFAASRARLLRAAYEWPLGAGPGPRQVPEFALFERSERAVISFLIGQTIAQTLAKKIWNIPRLLHRSLYGPLLPSLSPALGALDTGPSPDYLCLPQGGAFFSLIEAKGTNSTFNPQTNAKHLDRLNGAFQQIAMTSGAYETAVSVACLDSKLPKGVIAGQFWDPPNPRAAQIHPEDAGTLTAEYFRRLTAVLNCLGVPIATPDSISWNAHSIGLRISVDIHLWELLRHLTNGTIADFDFFNQISEMLIDTNDVEEQYGRNGDGLRLELIDYDSKNHIDNGAG